jgi:hypothetical protein
VWMIGLLLLPSCASRDFDEADARAEWKRQHRRQLRECVDHGGIERRGIAGLRVCVIPYADAGKKCRDSAECAGRCLVVLGRGSEEPTPGGEVSGECEPDDQTLGCFLEITGGIAGQAICVD